MRPKREIPLAASHIVTLTWGMQHTNNLSE